jgi:hypothetical protein
VSFLRRLLGGSGPREAPDAEPEQTPAELLADEQERDRQLLRAEAERMDDDFLQRQMRYADRAWTPPAQGGTKRSDDEGAPEE